MVLLKKKKNTGAAAHCFLRQNMLHMQHHFLCNISYVVNAASMENSRKYTTINIIKGYTHAQTQRCMHEAQQWWPRTWLHVATDCAPILVNLIPLRVQLYERRWFPSSQNLWQYHRWSANLKAYWLGEFVILSGKSHKGYLPEYLQFRTAVLSDIWPCYFVQQRHLLS